MFMTRNFPAKIASYGPNRSGIHTKKGGARYAYDEDAYSKTNPPCPAGRHPECRERNARAFIPAII